MIRPVSKYFFISAIIIFGFASLACLADVNIASDKSADMKKEQSALFKLYQQSNISPQKLESYLKENNLIEDKNLLTCFNKNKQKITALMSNDDLDKAQWCEKEWLTSYNSEMCRDPLVELYIWFKAMNTVLAKEKKWEETDFGKVKIANSTCATGAVLGSVIPSIGNVVGCVVGGATSWSNYEKQKASDYVDLLSCP